MNTHWQDETLCLTGDITVHSITAERWRDFCRILTQHKPQQIDFSGVGRVDSTCLAVLAESQRQHGVVKLVNVPDAVGLLAQLYETENWINT